MKKEKSPVAEYMKIRRYMLNFVEQAGEKSVQAPTILELSRKFGVSRPTVSKAMKMLTDDGYIIGRPRSRRLYQSCENQPSAGDEI